ncbi:MAG: arginine--tRNA ligase, partial [Halanaerobiales bacterium]
MMIVVNNMIAQVEERLLAAITTSLRQSLKEVEADVDYAQLPEIEIEVPREKEHGDYASNVAMVMARYFQESPRDVAGRLADNFNCELVKEVEIAGPGFINFFLDNSWLHECLQLIIDRGKDYGRIDVGQGESIQIEFVSANPTGPLHAGHSRGAVVGDILASILDNAGYDVEREYYINNVGNQINVLGSSLQIRYRQQCGEEVDLPEEAYSGAYLIDYAADLHAEYGDKLLERSEEEQKEFFCDYAYKRILRRIKTDLKNFGIEFDSWFSERQLHSGKISAAIDQIRDEGYIYEKDEALWLESTAFGDDKDRVVIKSDGDYTYLAADIAYHLDKLERGYDGLINIWGADHHGYVSRVKAAVEALGYDEEVLEIILVQMVTLLRKGKKVSMSKREGNFVTMKDILEEVGRDAARYFYIMRSTDSHLDFDLELAKEQSKKNPVYYIQYAHARIQSIVDNADDINIEKKVELSLLQTEEEVELMKLLARFPEEIKISAENRQPHYIAGYAHDLAGAFHQFYNTCRVITEDKNLTRARYFLVLASRQVLRNVLEVLGVSAP